jgi:uncharacterized RDD family membrane protein YckC
MLLDVGTYLAVFFTFGMLSSALFENYPLGRVFAFGLIVAFYFSYEPIMVTYCGGTLGHRLMNIRVADADTHFNLPFWRAIIRTIVKQFFGILSLGFMFVTRRAQSLHDLAARSEVVVRNPKRAGPTDYYVPTAPLPTGLGSPSRVRRIVVIGLYTIAVFFVTGLIGVSSLSQECLEADICSQSDRQVEQIIGVLFVVLFGTIATWGWTGRLPGCRVSRKPDPH